MGTSIRVVGATPLDGFRLALEFSDEMRGVADLSSILPSRGVQDDCTFQGAFVSDGNNVSWPCGIVLSASKLYNLIQTAGCSQRTPIRSESEYTLNRRDLGKILMTR